MVALLKRVWVTPSAELSMMRNASQHGLELTDAFLTAYPALLLLT